MTAPTDTTSWLALFLGLYLLAGGFSAVLRGELWADIMADFERSPGLVAISGVVAFVVGALVVTVHNIWTSPAAIIVSMGCWIACAEGLSLLLVPQLWMRVAKPVLATAKIWGTFMIVVGAYLLSVALFSWT